jgi:hypothetical protein
VCDPSGAPSALRCLTALLVNARTLG